MAVTESRRCWRVCPSQNGPSSSPEGWGLAQRGALRGSPWSPRTCSLCPCPSGLQPAESLGWAVPPTPCPAGLCQERSRERDVVPRAQACTAGGQHPRHACFWCGIRPDPSSAPQRFPGIPVPAHTHRTQQHLQGSGVGTAPARTPQLPWAASGALNPFSQASER